MPHSIEPNYDQLFLLPPSLEDWLPPDDPARFIRAFVDELDFTELGFPQEITEEGRPRYSLSMLTKIWLYGRMHRMKTTRALEIGCYRDIGLIWLTGMNYPDHNTIWRFNRDYDMLLQNVLKQSIQIATKSGLVGLVLNAIDGTKISADISSDQNCSSTLVKKILAHIDEIVEEIEREIEKEPLPQKEIEYRLPENLSDPRELTKLVQKLSKAQKEEKKVTLTKETTEELKNKLEELVSQKEGLSDPVDPDARVMKCDQGKRPGYNAEVVVDDKHGIIVAADVTQENNDRRQLAPMIEQTIENTGQSAETTLADGDYFSGVQLDKADKLKAKVLVNDNKPELGKDNAYHCTNFIYDEEYDCYRCPQGHMLRFKNEIKGIEGSKDRLYICTNLDCSEREKCSKSETKGRTIRQSAFIEAIEGNRQNLAIEENRELLKRRKAIVEPVFGHIKHNEGYRRWRVRGLSKVRPEWHLIAITYNLKKMYRLWRDGVFSFEVKKAIAGS